MTYGDIAAQLRDQLTWLLERRRIGQRLGGPGSFRMPATTTEAERATLGEEIQRCRDAVLTYCLEAVRAATPTANLDGNQRRRDVVGRLRHQLEETYAGVPFGEPRSSMLERLSRFELVARWQHAARLASQGEREIAALQCASLSREQQRVVLKDSADLVRGLVVLDSRYRGIPGWSHVAHRDRLLSAADVAASHLAARKLDLSVDHLGWHPDPGAIEGPALPGIAAVLQAQHTSSSTSRTSRRPPTSGTCWSPRRHYPSKQHSSPIRSAHRRRRRSSSGKPSTETSSSPPAASAASSVPAAWPHSRARTPPAG